MSAHKLLHLWIAQGVLTSAQAFEYSEAILSAKRGSDYTEEELIEGGRGPGRVGPRNGLKPTLRVQPLARRTHQLPSLAHPFRLFHPAAILRTPRSPPFAGAWITR